MARYKYHDRFEDNAQTVIRSWVSKADADLIAAICLARICPHTVSDIVCYLSQQCLEKYFKAYLSISEAEWQARFERTHDLIRLSYLASELDWTFVDFQRELEKFDEYGIEIRYPDTASSIKDADSAIRLAIRLRNRLHMLLDLRKSDYVNSLWRELQRPKQRLT